MKKFLFSLMIVGVFVCLMGEVLAEGPADSGTMQCRGVQTAIQAEMGNYNSSIYKNALDYKIKSAQVIYQALKVKLINWRCAWCIFKQFLRLIPINKQTACGTNASPTEFCDETNFSSSQMEASIEISISQFKNLWSQADQFEALFKQTQQILGCKLNTSSSKKQIFESSSFSQVEGECAQEGVNYCGPGTSLTNPALDIINVPASLNEACCHHDSCYGKKCVDGKCYWTTQSEVCDNSLLANCQGKGSSSQKDLQSPVSQFVCAIVKWESGAAGNVSVAERNKRIRDNPPCQKPASLQTCGVQCEGKTCDTFTTCNPKSGCQDPVCGTIVEGGGVCVEGTTYCDDLPSCSKSEGCYEGLCLESSCCGRNVCVNAQVFCPDIGVENSTNKRVEIFQSGLIGSCIAH